MNMRFEELLATRLSLTVAALLLAAPVVQAYEITYDFTAHGTVTTFNNEPTGTEGPEETISGSVTFDVRTVAPPAGATTLDGYYAVAWDDPAVADDTWVIMSLTGTTSQGSLEPAGLPGDALYHLIQVSNTFDSWCADYSIQGTTTQYFQAVGEGGALQHYDQVEFHRFTCDAPAWFDGLNFDSGLSPQYNYLYRSNYWISFATDPPYDKDGYASVFVIDTYVVSLRPLAEAVAGVGPGQSLASKMRVAQAYYAAGDMQSTCLMLADFASEVRAQRGKKLTIALADKLTADTGAVMTVLGCN